MLKRALAIAVVLAAVGVGMRWSLHREPTASASPSEVPSASARPSDESEREGESEHEREPERGAERERERQPPTIPERMTSLREDVHLLEMQRLDAHERGDRDTEARLDREITAARAEHDRLRRSLGAPEGI